MLAIVIVSVVIVSVVVCIYLLWARFVYRYDLRRVAAQAVLKYKEAHGLGPERVDAKSMTWDGDHVIIQMHTPQPRTSQTHASPPVAVRFKATLDPAECVMERTVRIVNGAPTKTVTGTDCLLF
jgi:hypothetical protein